jgi:hypothetical protein
MKITIKLDTEDGPAGTLHHPEYERNVELLDQLGPTEEGFSACGVLRYLALHVRPEEFADLVEHGRLIVTARVQDSAKAANRASLEKMD